MLVVFFHRNDRVFALRHLQILLDAVLAARRHTFSERVGLVAAHALRAAHGIDVEREEEVGLVFVGDFGALPEVDEAVGGARIDHFHVGTVALDAFSEGQRVLQREVFLLRDFPHAACVPSAVSGIDDKHEFLRRRRRQRQKNGQKQQQNAFRHLIYIYST